MIRKNEELDMDTEDAIDVDPMDVDDDKNKNMNQRIIETMKYGQELQSLYGQDERDAFQRNQKIDQDYDTAGADKPYKRQYLRTCI